VESFELLDLRNVCPDIEKVSEAYSLVVLALHANSG
jgi:hypothetical protein